MRTVGNYNLLINFMFSVWSQISFLVWNTVNANKAKEAEEAKEAKEAKEAEEAPMKRECSLCSLFIM